MALESNETEAPEGGTAQGPDEAAELAARAARGEALLANAQGTGQPHVRTEYEPLDAAEANRKAARRTAPRKGKLQPAKYEPYEG
ncbi:hypothetical protein SEA_AMGINE_96 [Mycobacterium phage Amgine]|uniref:Uncharacterized protein n=1 Tax=Mycobacterium phage Amgine TaxID=2015817 RepID=A0A222ZLV1_9CAUD|nr:hypothetical protein I5G84_gp96 [Mycobacterium phage Amgine]ASR85696.1 hypothetical protein SEA_AMGINE_96 [Mycobacterium phage Amgine]